MDVKIYVDMEKQKVTAQIYGDIDHHTAKHIRTEIDASIKEYLPKLLIIDFSNVSFMDSSGIGLVMGRYKLMGEYSGDVLIANPPPYIRRVMQLAGLDKLCRVVNILPPEQTHDKPAETRTTAPQTASCVAEK